MDGSRLRTPAIAASAVLALALGSVVPAAASGKGAMLEKTVDVPRSNRVPVGLSFGQATLVSVESHNDPKEKDVAEARTKDPDDKTFVLIRFYYRNDDYTKHKVSLRTVLLDEDGAVLGEAGRTGTLDPKTREDTLTYPMKVRTIDWANATRMKVIATFLN